MSGSMTAVTLAEVLLGGFVIVMRVILYIQVAKRELLRDVLELPITQSFSQANHKAPAEYSAALAYTKCKINKYVNKY